MLRDQATGQGEFDLTDFGYLPDGSTVTTAKSGKVTWVSPTGGIRTLANLSVKTIGDLGLTGLAVAPVPGNPYYDTANPNSARSKVFASGFRSPFRFSLDPSSGLPVVGDVGWNTWEEVDVVQPGRNYAWPCWEGNHRTPGYMDLPECANVQNQAPIWDYHHGSGVDQGNSVTGGFVYTGSSYPAQYKGTYFYGDYVTNKIWTMRYDATGTLTQAPQSPAWGTGIGGPVEFAAPNGDLVFADIQTGNLRRLSYTQGNTAPVATATSTTNPDTRTVTFDGSSSLDYDGDTLRFSR